MISGLAMIADILIELRIGHQIIGRRDSTAAIWVKRWLMHNLASDTHRRAELLPVLLVRHIVK